MANNIDKAKGLIIKVTASPDITLDDLDVIMQKINDNSPGDCDIIFGVSFNNEMVDEIIVTIISADKTA